MVLDLTSAQRFNLRMHNLKAFFAIGNRMSIKPRRAADLFHLKMPDGELTVPSAIRWRFYRQRYARRLELLATDYGYAEFRDVFTPDAVVLDIGANVGEFTLFVVPKVRQVVAIDADPTIFRCLSANLAQIDNADAINQALWNEEAELEFFSEPRRADSSFFDPGSPEAATRIELAARPLDDVIAPYGFARIDFIKCDAEGAEPEVLTGAAATLAITRNIVIDTGPEREGKRTHIEVERILNSHGFSVEHVSIRSRQMTFGRKAGMT